MLRNPLHGRPKSHTVILLDLGNRSKADLIRESCGRPALLVKEIEDRVGSSWGNHEDERCKWDSADRYERAPPENFLHTSYIQDQVWVLAVKGNEDHGGVKEKEKRQSVPEKSEAYGEQSASSEQEERNEMDLSIVFKESSAYTGGEEAPTVGLVWEGWEETANTPGDVISSISLKNLEDSGRALSLALMILGRETDY